MLSDRTLRTFLGVSGIFAASILMLFVVGAFLHELGHVLAALLVGVPFSEIGFVWHGLGPGVTIPATLSDDQFTIFRFAGGFFAAAVLLIVYAVYVARFREKLAEPRWWLRIEWWFSYPLLLPVSQNLVNGWFEGTQFE